MSTTAWPASTAQVAFLSTLWAERQHDFGAFPVNVSKQDASAFIDALKLAPRKSTSTSAPVTEAGFYRKGEDIIKAVPSRNGGIYGKVLVQSGDRGSWDYRPGLLSGVKPEDRLTLDEAKAFGRTHGWCIACGALLTDPASIEAGIGPVCATRF